MTEELRELASRLESWCVDRPVKLCVLFGSRARGEERAESDVDLAIWPSRSVEAADLLKWHRELARLLDREVQVALITDDIDPVLGMQIAREGRCIFESERGMWLESRVRLWQLYQDALPFIRAARQHIRDYADEVRRGS